MNRLRILKQHKAPFVTALLLAAFLVLLFSTAAMADISRSLRIGDTGTDVGTLQSQLKTLGYYYPSLDGIFGLKTRVAVTQFQLRKGLIPDGIAGPLTMAAIAKSLKLNISTSPTSTTPANPTTSDTTTTNTGNNHNTGSGSFPTVSRGTVPGVPTTYSTGHKEILGYVEDQDPASYNSIVNYSSSMTSVATFSYKITSWGGLVGTTPAKTVRLAKSRGLKPLVLIHNLNGSFDPALADNVLAFADNRQTLINNLLNLVRNNGYAGVNIDIEGIYKSDRANYVALVRETKRAFAPYGLSVTVAIPAKDYDNPWNSWSNGYDYQGIGQAADKVVIMTYDENWGGNGPVASLPWVTKVVQYAVSQMPREKILLGIATYGYDYPDQSAYGMRYIKNTLIPKWGGQLNWSDQYSEPYYVYWSNSTKHTVWFENEFSNALKLNLVNQYNLGGIGIWRLGYEDQSFWNVVNSKLR